MARKRPAQTPTSCCDLRKNPQALAAAQKLADSVKDTLPAGLAAPARRALAVAGLKNLDDIARFGEAEIATLHGIGPNALKTIRAALQAAGQTFRQR